MSKLTSAPSFTSMVTVALLILMLAIGGFAYDGFFSPQVLLNLLIDNAFLLVLAIGMGFVILSGGIDLSVGSVLALTTMMAAWMLQKAQMNPALVIVLVLAFGAVFGAAQGALIHYFRLQPFIVTLAGMFLARGMCYLISIDSITIDNPTFTAISQYQFSIGDVEAGTAYFVSPGAVIGASMVFRLSPA